MVRISAVRIAENSTASSLWNRLQRALAPTYRLERELGGGGMSRVFLARRGDARPVAVKVLADGAADLLELRRFRQEIAITTALRHPHVLPVLDSGESAGLAWFITPFVAEGSLRDLLRRNRRLTLARTVGILSDVADALAYAHSCGVVHGDIKPENVLLTNSRALLADFGGARLRFIRRTAGTGESDAPVIGTPLYMSPEQAAGESTFDGRADLYSLGIVGWELLTGRPPFTGADPRSVLLAHLGAPVPPLRVHRADVPEQLATLVERMLAKDPDERPRSAFVVRTALDSALERPAPQRQIAIGHSVRARRVHRAHRPLSVTTLSRAAAALLATAVTGASLLGAASLFPATDSSKPVAIAAAAPTAYEEPTRVSRLQELKPLVIQGHAAPTAHGVIAERTYVVAQTVPAAAAMPAPIVIAATAATAPVKLGTRPPAPSAPAAPPAVWRDASKTRVFALSSTAVTEAVTEADTRVLAEIQRAAVVLGRESGKLAMHVVRDGGERLPVADTIRVHVNSEHAAAIRELAAARVALGSTFRRLELRAGSGQRTIELVVPCAPPAPPTPPPATDCGARITVPVTATRPVGA